jgi:hypothetical protein
MENSLTSASKAHDTGDGDILKSCDRLPRGAGVMANIPGTDVFMTLDCIYHEQPSNGSVRPAGGEGRAASMLEESVLAREAAGMCMGWRTLGTVCSIGGPIPYIPS